MSLRPQRLPVGPHGHGQQDSKPGEEPALGPQGDHLERQGREALAWLTPKRQKLLPTVEWLFQSQVLLPGNPDRFPRHRLSQCSSAITQNTPEGEPGLARHRRPVQFEFQINGKWGFHIRVPHALLTLKS